MERKMRIWSNAAPSNIALIKYMGKKDTAINMPSNPSLSYTLTHLKTTVTLELTNGNHDIWQPLQTEDALSMQPLSEKAQERFLQHLAFLKTQYNFHGSFIVRSCSNFPQSCGIASSASSFA